MKINLTDLPKRFTITISADNDMLKELEKIYKALGDRNRLRIINMLKNRAMCVCEITNILNLSQSTVSGHLRVLKEAGIVEDAKDGLWVEYSLNRDRRINEDFLDPIQALFEADSEMKQERQKALLADRQVLCKK
jgi:ArsR family transcriptional regulator